MGYIRWYDNNAELKRLFEILEGLDVALQNEIAKDIIQILLTDFGLNLDKEINQISSNYKFECKRWYDKNIDLFTSFEIIRNLTLQQQNELVEKVLQSIVLIYMKEK